MGWTWERGVLPVPMTVTAREVNWEEEFTEESQPPDRLLCSVRIQSPGVELKEGAREVLQRFQGSDDVWPSGVTVSLHINEEVQGLCSNCIENTIVARSLKK